MVIKVKVLFHKIKKLENMDGSITMSEIKEWLNSGKHYRRVTVSTVWEREAESEN
jgi:hypothetical protein